jgi:hypothetical protein
VTSRTKKGSDPAPLSIGRIFGTKSGGAENGALGDSAGGLSGTNGPASGAM